MTGHRFEVRVEPIDPLLFGDNRSARAGEDHALSDQDPSPATLYGGIGARVARALGAAGEGSWSLAEAVLGPFAPKLDSPDGDRRCRLLGYAFHDPDGRLWFPRPLHFRVERIGGKLSALGPLLPMAAGASQLSSIAFERRLVLPRAQSGALPKEVDEDLLVGEDLLGEILASPKGPLVDAEEKVLPLTAFARSEYRLGLAITNRTSTAVEHQLFARPYRRFRGGLSRMPASPGWRPCGYTAWFETRSGPPEGGEPWDGQGFVGGDRRRARFTFRPMEDKPLLHLLNHALSAAEGGTGFFAYLLTPAVATGEWPRLGGRSPVAAALGKSRYASGWSAASARQSPRPILSLIPAGSVIFYEWLPGESSADRRQVLEEAWLGAVSELYARTGFGRLLLGVWS